MKFDIWMLAFIFTYTALIFVIYKAWLSKIINTLRHKDMFLHWHVIDTGACGDYVFKETQINKPDGKERTYNRACVTHGTLFYEDGNAEPLKIKQDIPSYKYYCDTKNFDTVSQ